MTSRKVPRLSLMDYVSGNDSERQHFVDAFLSGLKDYGFIVLTDHPVGQDLINAAYLEAKKLFELPQADKNKYVLEHGQGQRGLTPFGVEHAKDYAIGDLKEFWHIGREVFQPGTHNEQIFPPNIWPKELPHFKPVFVKLYQELDHTAFHLLKALGDGLMVGPGYLPQLAENGLSVLRLIHYPPLNAIQNKVEGAVRSSAHGDINLITLLVGATDSGLELLDRDGKWLAVESAPGEIVVDSGDMLSRITNDIIPATIHRVVNPKDSNRTRFSMPFFVHPNPLMDLECLPSCVGNGAKYPPINSYALLQERLNEIGLKGKS